MKILKLVFRKHGRGFLINPKHSLKEYGKIGRPKIFLKDVNNKNLRFVYKSATDNKRKTLFFKNLFENTIWFGSLVERDDLIILKLENEECILFVYKDCWSYRDILLTKHMSTELIIS